MIAGVIGYDSIRKHLAECVMNTGTYKKEIQSSGCVHKKSWDEGDQRT